MIRIAACLVGFATLTACSADLVVYDASGKKLRGVSFRATELYKKTYTKTAHSKGGVCKPVDAEEIVSLTTGALYFVSPDTAELGKSEFTVKLGNNGGLTEVTLNSEPAAAEQIKAGNELLQTVLGAAGLSETVTSCNRSVYADDREFT